MIAAQTVCAWYDYPAQKQGCDRLESTRSLANGVKDLFDDAVQAVGICLHAVQTQLDEGKKSAVEG